MPSFEWIDTLYHIKEAILVSIVKGSPEWKVDRIKDARSITVKERNKTLTFRYRGDNLFVRIGDHNKDYLVKNMTEVLYAIADEKDYLEVYLSNPDSFSRSTIYVIDMKITTPGLW